MVYMWSYFLINYESLLAATIAFVLISLSLVFGIALVILNRAVRQNLPWLLTSVSDDGHENHPSFVPPDIEQQQQQQRHNVEEEDLYFDDTNSRRSSISRGRRNGSSSRGVAMVLTTPLISGTTGEDNSDGSNNVRWRL